MLFCWEPVRFLSPLRVGRKQRRAAANLPMGEWVDNGSFLDSQNTGWLGSQGLRSSDRLYIAHGSCFGARLGVIRREWDIWGK